MDPDLDLVGKRLLSQSSGQPASGYVRGTLYLFSFADGVIRAQPCAAQTTSSTLGAPPTLYYLYRRIAPSAGWAAVGGWLSLAEAEAEMTSALVQFPASEFGAYEWDGQAMTWKFL